MSLGPPPYQSTSWYRYVVVPVGVFVAFSAWVGLFAGGILIQSEPYRRVVSEQRVEELKRTTRGPATALQGEPGVRSQSAASPSAPAEPTPDVSVLTAFLVSIYSFTPSNLALLCCVAGVLGAMGRRASLSNEESPHSYDRKYPFMSALLRGFFVYLTVISGMFILIEDPILGQPSPGQYTRLAGLLSLASFVVNYDPAIFATLVDRIRHRFDESPSEPEERPDVEDEALEETTEASDAEEKASPARPKVAEEKDERSSTSAPGQATTNGPSPDTNGHASKESEKGEGAVAKEEDGDAGSGDGAKESPEPQVLDGGRS